MKSAREQRIAELTATTAHLERQIAALKGDVGMELDEAACAHQKQHPDVSYSDSLQAAMQEHPNLAAEYVASFGTHKLGPEQVKAYGLDEEAAGKGSEAAGKELDRLVKAQLAAKGLDDSDYERTLGEVLADPANAKLSKAWMGRGR